MIEPLVKHLAQFAKLEDSIDLERFDATLSQIANLKDPRAISLLIPFFDDKCRFHEAMFSIVHTIEAFDDELYACEILKALPQFYARSPYWAAVVHYGILNSPGTRAAYRVQLAKADPASKEACCQLLNSIREKRPQLAQQCDELLAVL